MTRSDRVLLLFLDGVGVGPDDPDVNPFVAAEHEGVTPFFGELFDGSPPTLAGSRRSTGRALAFPLDASLDVDDVPQSGTGQVALLTGADAARMHGAHFGPWTPVALRPLVEEQSLLRRARDAGKSVTFANAYPRGWPGPRGSRRVAGPPLAARGAGVLDRHEEALGSGDAVSSEIVNDGWRTHLGHDWLPEVTPREAGANLARVANGHDLTLYAHYTTDAAGHAMSMERALDALRRVDGLLDGLADALNPDVTVLVASDHGNIEDVRLGHTTNPALGLAWGPLATEASELTDLRHVTPFVLDALGVPDFARGAEPTLGD